MTFFAAIYGQEKGRIHAGWVARAKAECLRSHGRNAGAWNEQGARLERNDLRSLALTIESNSNPGERERLEEDGERWDGLS